MSFHTWLRKQVHSMENEISGSTIFESEDGCSRDDLQDIKRMIVIRSFLEQQLRRMENRRVSRIAARSGSNREASMLTSA